MKTCNHFLILILALLLSSCVAYNTGGKTKFLSVGMTKEQVVGIMGTNYEVAEGLADADGNSIEVMEYRTIDDAVYHIEIVNSKLTTWRKVWLSQYHHSNPKTMESATEQ